MVISFSKKFRQKTKSGFEERFSLGLAGISLTQEKREKKEKKVEQDMLRPLYLNNFGRSQSQYIFKD